VVSSTSSAQRLRQLVAPAGADQRHDILPARECPREGDLRHGDALGVRHGTQPVDERQVLAEVLALGAGHPSPEGATAWLRVGLVMAADQSA
jgi:hypothetical protein